MSGLAKFSHQEGLEAEMQASALISKGVFSGTIERTPDQDSVSIWPPKRTFLSS